MLTASQVFRWNKDYYASLSSDDERFNRSAQIIIKDGTVLFYKNCFLIKTNNYLHWFPEHNQSGFSHIDEVLKYNEFVPKYKIEEINID